MTSGILQTGIYETRDELAEAIRGYYEAGSTLADIAFRCEVTLRCVRRLVVERGMTREDRPVVERKPLSIRGHELKLVRDPCWREWCGGCVFHRGVA